MFNSPLCRSLYANPELIDNPIYSNLRAKCEGSDISFSGQSSDDAYVLDPGIEPHSTDFPTLNFSIPPEIQEYINQQLEYGFKYYWEPNGYYQPNNLGENDIHSQVGRFVPFYVGSSDMENIIQRNPNIGHTIVVYDARMGDPQGKKVILRSANYIFDLLPFQPQPDHIRNKYKLDRVLGRGSFGVTYLAQDIIKNRMVAIKIINFSNTTIRGINHSLINNEIQALTQLSANGGNEYIATYYENFEDLFNGNRSMFIVSEYIDGVTLSEFLRLAVELEPTALWPLYLQLTLGLNYIHKNGYAHRDIKPDNIMVTPDYKIKYIDFGLSCLQQCRIDSCNNNCLGVIGTTNYIPPELLNKSRPLNFDAYLSHDIWALGLTMYQMANQSKLPESLPISSSYDRDGDNRTNYFLQSVLKQDWTLRPNIDDCIRLLIKLVLSPVWQN